MEYEGNQYVQAFLAEYKEEQIQSFQMKAAIFDEELTLKTYVLIDEEGIQLVA